MEEKQANIQQQIRGMRRVVLTLSISAFLILLGMLLFIPIDERIIATGFVRAERDSRLFSPVDGILGHIEAYEGKAVAKGDPVVFIDDTDLRDRLRQINASIDKARVDLTRQKAVLERTTRLPLPKEFWHMQEELGIARERIRHSELEYQRASELQKKGSVSMQDLERAQLALDVAKAEEAKAREKLRIVESGLESTILNEAAAEIQAAYSALRQLEIEREICMGAIERCILRAPEDGTVTYIGKNRPGEGVKRGEPLANLAHGEATRVDVFCGENQYYRIAPGQRVLMRSNAFDTLRHGYVEGRVVRLSFEPEDEEDIAEIPPGGPGATAGPKYRVVTKVESSPQKLTLGSTVEARIIIRRIPLWKLFLPDSMK